MRPVQTSAIHTVKEAKRQITNLAAIRRRIDSGMTTGRNDSATWATVENKVRALSAFFAEAEETAEIERLYERFNALERWSVGLI